MQPQSPSAACRGGRWRSFFRCLLRSRQARRRAGGESLLSPGTGSGLLAPAPAARGDAFGSGGVLAPQPQPEWPPANPRAPAPTAVPVVPAGQAALALSARFGKTAPQIEGGLTWRVYAAKRDAAGQYPAHQGRQVAGADAGAPGRKLHRACRLWARHRGQARDLERADPARGLRPAGRRHAPGRRASAMRAFRPDRSRSTSTKAASSSLATAGRSLST